MWIEIRSLRLISAIQTVTLHTEGVDWNIFCFFIHLLSQSVTLHTEGVDWNQFVAVARSTFAGHPPHGGCGLKYINRDLRICLQMSPSTRRVWIEMGLWPYVRGRLVVTLHTEGVDWNVILKQKKKKAISHPPHGGCGLKSLNSAMYVLPAMSPSTRRVWIEICVIRFCSNNCFSHPPHGGCGLKWNYYCSHNVL